MKLLEKIFAINLLLITLLFVSCGKDDSATAPKDSIPEIPGYTLVWNDEFDQKNIDLTKWEHEVNGDGGGNNELQFYTARPTNSFIENGHLVIKALPENYQNRSFTSARIRSKNKGDWLYGRIEASAKATYRQRNMACNLDVIDGLGIRRLARKR